MKKYLQNTLNLILIPLFFINFNLNAEENSTRISACNAALDKGDAAAALSISDEILKAQANSSDALLCKGRALGAQGKYDAALSALDAAAKQSKTRFDEIVAHILIGNLHKINNKNAEAIAAYEKSLRLCEAEKNDKFRLINHNLIGETQAQNNDLNAALASYLAGSKLTKNDNERADSFERLGATYSALDQHNLAIEYQLKGMLMQQKSGTLDQYADATLALGKVYEKAKEYPNAEKTYAKLIQFAKDNGGAYYEAKANIGLAQTKAASGDAIAAEVFIEKAKAIAKDTKDSALAQEIDQATKQ